MYAPSHSAFRLATLVLAALLGVQCVWLLLTELSRPGIDRLSTDAQTATDSARQRNDAIWTARIGAIRGELWAESALTYADLLWAGPAIDPARTTALEQARAELDKALGYAPHLADAWLLLAGLEERYPPHKSDPAEALKMSYYTGPTKRPLIALRLLVATRLDALDDIEIQQFIRRDLRFIFAQQQKSVVAEAYAGGSPAGKRFIEQAVGEIDPAYLESLRTQKP
jgi:hypothetical protein